MFKFLICYLLACMFALSAIADENNLNKEERQKLEKVYSAFTPNSDRNVADTVVPKNIIFTPDLSRGWVILSDGSLYETSDEGAHFKKLKFVARDLRIDEKKQLWDAPNLLSREISHQSSESNASADWVTTELRLENIHSAQFPKVPILLPLAIEDNGSLFWSLNHGETWTVQSSGLFDSLVKIEVSSNLLTVYSKFGAKYLSNDKGETWRSEGCRDGLCPDLQTIFKFTNKSFAWDNVQLAVSTDQEKTWSTIATKNYVEYVHSLWFESETVGLIGSASGLYRTVDGSKHWKKIGPMKEVRKIYSFNKKVLWTVGPAELFKTSDGGKSWSRVTLPKIAGDRVIADIIFQGKTGWISGEGFILKSDDSGASWKVVWSYDEPFAKPVLEKIFFSQDSQEVWVMGGETILRSDKIGTTWKQVRLLDFTPLDIVSISKSNEIYIVGSYGNFFSSSDDGLHWRHQKLSDYFSIGTQDYEKQTLNSNGALIIDDKLSQLVPARYKINYFTQSLDKKMRLTVGDKGEAFLNLSLKKDWVKVKGLPEKSLVTAYIKPSGENIWILSADGDVLRSKDSGLTFNKIGSILSP